MADVAALCDQLAGLTIAQAVELKNLLKSKYGIEPASGGPVGVVAMPQQPTTTTEKKQDDPTEFNVILESFTDKVKTIKVVRELTGQGLGEAKATVEGAPKAIKENVDKKTAEDVKKKLEESGAKVSVKPAG
jgi:large subunit ribosomal protein L7/L12